MYSNAATVAGMCLLIATSLAACRAKNAPTDAGVLTGGSQAEVVPVVSALGVQGRLATTVSGRENFVCTSIRDDTRLEGPCRRFTLINPRRGVLVAMLKWKNQHPLTLSVKTLNGDLMGLASGRSPQVLRVPVDAGSLYEAQVMLLEPWGGDAHQAFELLISVE
jgi:hypothetical protein